MAIVWQFLLKSINYSELVTINKGFSLGNTFESNVLLIGINKKHTPIHNMLSFFSVNQLDLSGHDWTMEPITGNAMKYEHTSRRPTAVVTEAWRLFRTLHSLRSSPRTCWHGCAWCFCKHFWNPSRAMCCLCLALEPVFPPIKLLYNVKDCLQVRYSPDQCGYE